MEEDVGIWADITHDPLAAQDAADELDRVAAHLQGLTDARRWLAREATIDWQGAGRVAFDADLDALLARSDDLVRRLRATAVRIAEETELAAAEQRRREHLRELWATGRLIPP